MQEYTEIRNSFEEKGYRMADTEFSCLVEYARRKAELAGKDESYLPLLLPDVVKEYFFKLAANAASALMAVGATK